MGLFRRPPDDSALSRDYLQRANGLQRKTLLTFVSINQIMKLPIASREYFGQPMADVFGLQPASDIVRKILAQDASVAAWVARDSLIALDALLGTMNTSWNDSLDIAMDAAGLVPGPELNPERLTDVPLRVREDMLGLANCIVSVFFAFERPGEVQNGDRTYYNHLFESPARATQLLAHEITAWSGAVIGRLLHTGYAEKNPWMSDEFEAVPTMQCVGWYPNPSNMGQIVGGDATLQRYWDGTDWSDQVRLRDGRTWHYETSSMFKTPRN